MPNPSRRQFLKMVGLSAAAAAGGCALPGQRKAEAAATAAAGRSNSPAKPNFVIVMADDMGYGDSSVYGGWIKTPHMEAMAAGGLTFTDFHSSGAVCSPTRAGLMTGRYQQRAGIPSVINADPKTPEHWLGLQTSEVTFPKLLKTAGYTSAIFGKWHLGYTTNYNPIHHGFDRFRGYVSGNVDYFSHHDRMGVYDWWDGLEQVKEEGYVTHLITRHSLAFLEENRDRPFCLYVAHEAVHTPLQAPGDPPGRGPDKGKGGGEKRPAKETYRLMMKAMDDGLGEILAKVKALGLAERTLVIFFSDNGGTQYGSNAPLRGGKGSAWEGGHRVPAIAWWPGKIKPGTTTDDLCISLDLMPTMLDLAGAAAPQGHKLDGVSLAPLMLEGKSLGRRQLVWNGTAMRDGPWKLVTAGGKAQLFDLSNDIGEQTDLAARHPDRVREMVAALDAWKQDMAATATPQPGPPPGVTKKKVPGTFLPFSSFSMARRPF